MAAKYSDVNLYKNLLNGSFFRELAPIASFAHTLVAVPVNISPQKRNCRHQRNFESHNLPRQKALLLFI